MDAVAVQVVPLGHRDISSGLTYVEGHRAFGFPLKKRVREVLNAQLVAPQHRIGRCDPTVRADDRAGLGPVGRLVHVGTYVVRGRRREIPADEIMVHAVDETPVGIQQDLNVVVR